MASFLIPISEVTDKTLPNISDGKDNCVTVLLASCYLEALRLPICREFEFRGSL